MLQDDKSCPLSHITLVLHFVSCFLLLPIISIFTLIQILHLWVTMLIILIRRLFNFSNRHRFSYDWSFTSPLSKVQTCASTCFNLLTFACWWSETGRTFGWRTGTRIPILLRFAVYSTPVLLFLILLTNWRNTIYWYILRLVLSISALCDWIFSLLFICYSGALCCRV